LTRALNCEICKGLELGGADKAVTEGAGVVGRGLRIGAVEPDDDDDFELADPELAVVVEVWVDVEGEVVDCAGLLAELDREVAAGAELVVVESPWVEDGLTE
jgi:hypothetical protein